MTTNKHKHTHNQCQTAVSAIKSLLEQIKRSSGKGNNTIHVCESALDICNKLLREPEK
jgi:hypothetical protein